MTNLTTKILRAVCVACAGLAVLTVHAATSGDARPDATGAPRAISLPAGSLASALNALIDQAGMQIIYAPSLAEGVEVKAINGTLTFREALDKLLENSGLRADSVNARTVVLRRAGEATSGIAPAQQMQLASVENAGEREQAGTNEARETPHVVVEGARDRPPAFSTANIDLMRTEDDVLPFQVYTAEDIRQSGAATLQDFFRDRLPQNHSIVRPDESIDGGQFSAGTTQTLSNSLNFNGGGGRGYFGAAELVVLVNGRRLPNRLVGEVNDAGLAEGNYQGIPIRSIERIEVLSSAASALYGEGATTGAINIITRQDYRGGSLSVRYESPMDTSAPSRSVEFSYGMPLTSRTSARIAYSASDFEPLTLADRADVTMRRYRTLMLERNPAALLNNIPYGATTNVRTLSGQDNLFGPGTAAYTSYPAQQYNQYDLDLPPVTPASGSWGLDALLGPRKKNTSLNLGVDVNLSGEWRLTFEYANVETRRKGKGFAALPTIAVATAASPVNPYDVDVLVSWYDPRIAALNEARGVQEWSLGTHQASATLRGERWGWRMLFDASWSRDSDDADDVRFSQPAMSFSAAIAQGLYNPFVDVRSQPLAADAFYEGYTEQRNSYSGSTDNYQLSMKTSGALFALPAGPVELTAGLEWLRQDRNRISSAFDYVNTATGQRTPIYETQDVPSSLFLFDTYAAYSEVNVPLISARQGLRYARNLDVFASGRLARQDRKGAIWASQVSDYVHGKYSTDSNLYSAGFRFAPAEDVRLRLSRSIGIRAPLFSEVAPALPPTSATNVTDPRTGLPRTLTASMYITGGNPDLESESTRTMNYGLILTPSLIPGLRLSFDYSESTRRDAISNLSAQVALDLAEVDPGVAPRVTRDASGEITFVDARYINLLDVSWKTLNLSLEQRIPDVGGGTLVATASVVKNTSFLVQATASGSPQERIRNPAQNLSTPKWNGNLQLRWERSRFSTGWSARYFDMMLITPSQYAGTGRDRLPSAYDHDVFFNYNLGESVKGLSSVFEGASISAGIKNVFDRAPRFYSGTAGMGYYGADSLYGRVFWLTVGADF